MARFFGLLAIISLGLGFGGVIPPGSILNILLPGTLTILAVFSYLLDIQTSSRLADAKYWICVAWTLGLGLSLFLGGSYLFLGQPVMDPKLFWPLEGFFLFCAGAFIAHAHAFQRQVRAEIDHTNDVGKLHNEIEHRNSTIESLRQQVKNRDNEIERYRHRALYGGDQASRVALSSSYSRRY